MNRYLPLLALLMYNECRQYRMENFRINERNRIVAGKRCNHTPILGGNIDEMFPEDHYPFGKCESAQMFLNLDIIFERPLTSDYSMETIKYDRVRQAYIPLIAHLYEQGMAKKELPRLLEIVVKKAASRKTKRRSSSRFKISQGIKYIQIIDVHLPFEPEWHMRARGDWKKMPDGMKNGYWRYLNKLYTEPETAADPVPDWVQAGYPKIKGLEKLVSEARYDGQEYLRRKYGDDWKKESKQTQTHATISDIPDFLSGNMLNIIRNAGMPKDT